jgi:hypothetical protein
MRAYLWRCVILLFLAASVSIRAPAAEPKIDPTQKPITAATQSSGPADTGSQAAQVKRGAELAHQICQACHRFPEPDLLDKGTWENAALPFMGKWLGMSKMNLDLRPGRKYVETSGVFPGVPLLPQADWEAICRYYLESAPARPLPQAPHPKTQIGLKGFEVISPEYRFKVPLTTLVKIDPARKQFYLADAGSKTLNVLDAQGTLQFFTAVESPVVSLILSGDRLDATLIGSVTPSDEPQGKVVRWQRTQAGFEKIHPLINDLPRPVDITCADLNQDGQEDILVCGFGNYLGRLSWFENIGDNRYREHVLLEQPGAIKAYARDFNQDGLLDIFVLMAQGREGIYLFTNQGKGDFSLEPVVEFHPAFGSTYFELVDFNSDGFIDILAANGDNGEYPSPLKNYHGIRLYLNDGKNHFREAWFFPLHGAYKAMAADFNKDGKLDIAAISFFPDYDRPLEESFAYLENQGGLKFEVFSFPAARAGHWLTMDVGDLDGDGWPDIVLGSFIGGPNTVPQSVSDYWEKMGPSFVILRNNHFGKK